MFIKTTYLKSQSICYLFSEIVNLDWLSKDEYFIQENFSETELIIAADIIYDNSLFDALLTTVGLIFKHSPRCEKFILVNAVRNPDTEREFLDMLCEIFIWKHSMYGKFILFLFQLNTIWNIILKYHRLRIDFTGN